MRLYEQGIGMHVCMTKVYGAVIKALLKNALISAIRHSTRPQASIPIFIQRKPPFSLPRTLSRGSI